MSNRSDMSTLNLDTHNPYRKWTKKRERDDYDDNLYSSASLANKATKQAREAYAHSVPYFWEDPRELLVGRLVQHFFGNIRSCKALYANTAMYGLLLAIAIMNGTQSKNLFMVVQGSGSALDYIFAEQSPQQLAAQHGS